MVSSGDIQPQLGTIGDIDVLAPGLMMFGVLLLTMSTATSLAREVESGALERLRISRAPVAAYLAGVGAAQWTVAILAIGALLLASLALGIDNQGSYGALFLVLLLGAAAAIGPGFAVAAFARTRDEAAHLALLAALVMGFLSGAFFHLPGVTLARSGTQELQLHELLAPHHLVAAIREVLAGGALADAAGALAALSAVAVAYAAVGALLFWWRRVRLAPGRRRARGAKGTADRA